MSTTSEQSPTRRSFRTSSGRSVPFVPGYRRAHFRATAHDVYPPDEGFHGLDDFGFDGFVKDHYQYSIMVDFLESLGVDCHWAKTLDIGGAEGIISRLLRGEGRAREAVTIEINEFDRGVTTASFLREYVRFKLAAAGARFSPRLRRCLIGDGEWRGRKLTPLYRNYGYYPPKGSRFWSLRFVRPPTLDRYIVGDVFELNEQFDLITGFSVISYMDVERLFQKMGGLLVEGGICFLISDYWWFAVNSSLMKLGSFCRLKLIKPLPV